jgi:hypothetical protein
MDFNLDGIEDLIISCPTSGDKDLVQKGGNYEGRIKIYYGSVNFKN